MKRFRTEDGDVIERVSRWLPVRYAYNVSKRHSLYDYMDSEGTLAYFQWNCRKYALGQFMKFNCCPVMFYENDKLQHLSGYDATDYYKPLLIEIDDGGEHVSLYIYVSSESEV